MQGCTESLVPFMENSINIVNFQLISAGSNLENEYYQIMPCKPCVAKNWLKTFPLKPVNFTVSQKSRRQTTPSRKTGVEAKRPATVIPICFLLYILSTKYAILIRSGGEKKEADISRLTCSFQ